MLVSAAFELFLFARLLAVPAILADVPVYERPSIPIVLEASPPLATVAIVVTLALTDPKLRLRLPNFTSPLGSAGAPQGKQWLEE